MKKALILLVLGAVFITGCSKDSTKEKEDQTTKEALLDLKIKEATKVFDKYGWTPDSNVDRNSKAFRAEYEQMDLEQLDKMLKMFHEGVEYENIDSIKEDNKGGTDYTINSTSSYIAGNHSFEFGSSTSRIDFDFSSVVVSSSSAEISVPIVTATYVHKEGGTFQYQGETAQVEVKGEITYAGNKRNSVMKGWVDKVGNGKVTSFRI
ncbi:hypothetical protein M2306_000124 [Myroides gitamensis]|uniref:hypothetical protein n=1 Tax=Myroides odoratus TaxID=256 RepID=UPI00216A40A4|nr:hypothetical protein [Myroides odoratus]MCS4240287.1 hypothetical protein [Myroides odoratus]MDH6599430.1 hypothetical protein [Myroides gitamensis]